MTVCVRCSQSFKTTDVRRKYCSYACQKRAAARSDVGLCRTCRHCGDAYVVTNGKQRYCGVSCRIKANRTVGSSTNLRRNAEKRGAARGERFTLTDVIRTHGAACHLCCFPFTVSDYDDARLMPTVDHLTPISRGGLHAMSNVRPAHRACNAAKRDSVDVLLMSSPHGRGKRVIVRGR